MIVYLLHEKLTMKDKSDKKERKLTQARLNQAFKRVTWMTYRSDLEWEIIGSRFRSDAGWGCMIRTGQMLLFQALQRHVFGDTFDWDFIECSARYKEEYTSLLRL